jgi:hypothetical protein
MKYVYSLSLVLLLSACSSVFNSQSQKITMRTPGATEARCMIENEDMRYVAYTDQTIEIMHSPNALTVSCQAAGNRDRTIIVPSIGSSAALGNVVTGIVPGMAYDHFSRSAYSYPDEFVVSFEGMPVRSYPLPKYHNADLLNNNENNSTEYMGPTEIVTEETRQREPYVLGKKVNPYGVTPTTPTQENTSNPQPKVSYNPAEEDK